MLHPGLQLRRAPPGSVHGLDVGDAFRFSASSSTSLGSGSEVAVRIEASGIRPLHAIVTFAHGHARVRSVDGAHVWVDDRPLAGTGGGPYGPGALLRLPDGIEFELIDAVEVRDAALEAQLLEGAEPAAWRVYADRLEEGGDPLGGWMSRSFGPEALPVLRAAPPSLLTLDLSFGLITSALLDTTAEMTWRPWLEELLQTPYARLLGALEVVCVDDVLGPSERAERINQVVDCLLAVRSPPPLRHLRFGSSYQWAPGDELVAAFKTLQTHLPSLMTPLNGLVETRSVGRLDVIDVAAGWRVNSSSVWLVDARTVVESALAIEGPTMAPSLIIERQRPQYSGVAESPILHRGQKRARLLLRNGDVLQLGGIGLRFSLHSGLPAR